MSRSTPAPHTALPLQRHMPALQAYAQGFRDQQTGWDNLTLLGQLAGTGIDTGNTRGAFHSLTEELLAQLGQEVLRKTVSESRAKAQVAIDILVRNLFERTADIGFLATDQDLRDYLNASAELRGQFHAREALRQLNEVLRARFAEYVAKYSVYHDVVLLAEDGQVLVRLDERVQVTQCAHPLLAQALSGEQAYVEHFGEIDILPDQAHALIYAARVEDATGQPRGVLCLCFRFADEMRRIFANLNLPGDWSVITLLTAEDRVIASSDPHHLPLGALLQPQPDSDYAIQRFAAGEYLSSTTRTGGYQGYLGPGWYGHVMTPLQHAFEARHADSLGQIDAQVLQQVMNTPSLFSEELRHIPRQAEEIVHRLNLAIWNGHIGMGKLKHAVNPSFSRVLLSEIGRAGGRTRELFAESINDLHATVVSGFLQDSAFLASLAIDIMDRNLYERANDCRWWALTSAFREALAAPELTPDQAEHCSDILRYINSLYTVYTQLVLFDRRGRIVASSRDGQATTGRILDEEWIMRSLRLSASQDYVVSEFVPTPLYEDRATYIYAAAVHAPDDDCVVGGVGIVFDAQPQLHAMLIDALPRTTRGQADASAIGLFVDGNARVIASTHPDIPVGSLFSLDAPLAGYARHARFGIAEWGGRTYAIGVRGSEGYREYKSEQDCYQSEIQAIVMQPICEALQQPVEIPATPLPVRSETSRSESVEVATFRVGDRWLGLRPADIVEALDTRSLSPVPGAEGRIAGFLLHRGTPVPVFELHALAQASKLPTPAPHIILLQYGDSSWIGVLADELGPLLELPAERVRTVPGIVAGISVITQAVLPDSDEGSLLPILDVSRIAQRLDTHLVPLTSTTPRLHPARATQARSTAD